jgi:anti-sigma-K factor RskA
VAAALAAVSLALSLLYFTRPPAPVSADYIAVMTDDEAGPVWLLQAYLEAGEMRANSINAFPEPADKSYELWMLPDDQSPPVSLGLLDGTADSTLVLTAARIATLRDSSVLAVSVEPAGGSPTGAPTGPVILTAPLVST